MTDPNPESGGVPEPDEAVSRREWLLPAAILLVAFALVAAYLWREGIPNTVRVMMDQEVTSLTIALVTPPGLEDGQFRKGLALALDEVNAAGGIDGLPVKLKVFVENAYSEKSQLETVVADTLKIADKVVREPGLLAVVGHWASATSLPASSVYNKHRVLYLANQETVSSLTNHGFDYVFALQPNNQDSASMIARYALDQGLRRFIVLSDDTEYGSETVKMFSSWATQGGGEILFDGSLTSYGRSVDRLLLFLLDNNVFARSDIDAFFLSASSAADTAHFIRRARELGLTVPIMGTESIAADVIEHDLDPKKMKDVIGVSLFGEQSSAPKSKAFVTAFKSRFGGAPGQVAAVGYDAIKLLAYAAEKTQTRDSFALANWLRIMRHDDRFIGATGPLVFDARGLVTDTEVYVVRHDGTRFNTVQGYRKPFEWAPIWTSRSKSYRP